MPIWSESQGSLREWYASALGQSIIEQLSLQLDHILPGIFGYQGLQVGCLQPGQSLLAKAGIHRAVLLDAPLGNTEPAGPDGVIARLQDPGLDPVDIEKAPDFTADALNLPISNDVMKLVVLPHTLDFCHLPHQALREADRVLTNDGQIIIIGFNPWSMFGLGHATMQWRKQVPWGGQFYSRRRVTDWLSVLNYRVLDSSAFFLRPPIQSIRVLDKLTRLEKSQRWIGGVGGLYIVHAKKQTVPLTMSRRHWLRQRSGIAVGSFARVQENQAGRRTSSRREKSPD